MKRLKASDGLSAPEFLGRNPPAYLSILALYCCPNRHAVELPLPSGPVTCERCGLRMKLAL